MTQKTAKEKAMEDTKRKKAITIPEGNCYSHNYLVTYSEITPKGRLKPSMVVNYFQNLAVLHSDNAGYTLKWLRERHWGWILTGWHIRFGDLPSEGTNVTAETWTSPYRRSQADRDFVLKGEDGEVYAYASSRWFLMDTTKRRPVKLDKEFFAAYTFENGRSVAEENYKFEFPDDAPEIAVFSIPVMRRDTDTNRHANNAVYIDWAMDGVPDEIYDSRDLTELTVLYKKECRLGDQVRGRLYEHGDEVLCILTNDNDPETEFGRVLMRWE